MNYLYKTQTIPSPASIYSLYTITMFLSSLKIRVRFIFNTVLCFLFVDGAQKNIALCHGKMHIPIIVTTDSGDRDQWFGRDR